MAERHCLSALPAYLQELHQGPRQGAASRGCPDAEKAFGHPFPEGEHDGRVTRTVDSLQRKRRDPLAAFDPSGAASGAPLTETRALHIDDKVRRACSEPPTQNATHAVQLSSMQTFGVAPGIDCHFSGRRRSISPEFSTTRAEVAKRAFRYGDIVDVACRKHFQHAPAPGSSSPRLQDVAMECMDIDQYSGRARPAQRQPSSKGILPFDSPSYSLECKQNVLKASPRQRSCQYFEKVLESERYAQLIGRPQKGTDKEFQRMRLALEMKQQAEFEHESLEDQVSSSADDSKPDMRSGRPSMMSTTASEGSEPQSPRPMSTRRTQSPEPLSAASRSVFGQSRASEADQRVYGEEFETVSSSRSQKMPHRRQQIPITSSKDVPLGVRRMMASLMPHPDHVSEDLMDDLHAVLSASMHSIGNSQGAQRNTRYGCSPPRRTGNRRISGQPR